MPPRLPGSVELALCEVVPADHRFDITGAGVQRHQGPLRHLELVLLGLIDAGADGLLGFGLHLRIQRRVHPESAIVDEIFAVTLEQIRQDVGHEIGRADADQPRVSFLGQFDRLHGRAVRLLRSDVA